MTRRTPGAPVPVPGVMDVPDYFQGASSIDGVVDPVKLSSNENAYGPSPLAIAAIRDAACTVQRYPEGSAQQLSDAIAAQHSLTPANILTSTGSDDLIPTLMRAFVQRGDEGLYFADAFPKYRTNLIGIGARPVEVPRDKNNGYRLCLDAVRQALSARSRILLVDNPCNPTGAMFTVDELHKLHATLPANVILALDEAYVEFSDMGNAALQMATHYDNVVVFRTFSKAFAMAGLRIGWCTGATALLSAMQRLRPTFPLTNISIAAAIAALQDRAHMAQTVASIRRTRSQVVAALRSAGWTIPDPHGNFVMLRAGASAPMSVEAAQASLLDKQVLVRPLHIQGKEAVLRITIGTDVHMQRVIDALRRAGNG